MYKYTIKTVNGFETRIADRFSAITDLGSTRILGFKREYVNRSKQI